MNARKLSRKDSGQMIILMGVVLALSIFVISSLAGDIINLDIVISNERATSTVSEFNYIKETFGISLNYNLITDISNSDGTGGTLIFWGNIGNITKAFNQTREQFFALELRYGNIFDAELNKCWYSHLANESHVYHADVSLTLDDGKTYLAEDITYSIVCQPES